MPIELRKTIAEAGSSMRYVNEISDAPTILVDGISFIGADKATVRVSFFEKVGFFDDDVERGRMVLNIAMSRPNLKDLIEVLSRTYSAITDEPLINDNQ